VADIAVGCAIGCCSTESTAALQRSLKQSQGTGLSTLPQGPVKVRCLPPATRAALLQWSQQTSSRALRTRSNDAAAADAAAADDDDDNNDNNDDDDAATADADDDDGKCITI
jgi:hypothetical protein